VRALVFLEHNGDQISKGSLSVVSKAAALAGGDVGAVLIGGDGVGTLAPQVGAFGAARVHVAAAPELDTPLPQPRVDVLEQVVAAGSYDTVLFSNSVLAADVAAGLAARLDAGLNWDLVDLVARDNGLVGLRPALQDSVLVEVGWRSPITVALFRTGSFEPVRSGDGEAVVEQVTVTPGERWGAVRIVSRTAQQSEGPALEDAEVIVAGGMGLGSAEAFALAEELAAALGGVVGATRATVYAGWYPRSAQVGQTGTTVSPRLYLALGISGAIQHKVGMQNSKVIVAINKDPNAPIFEISDLAIVGDVHAIVPALTKLVRERSGS
jgi:electron transfer flavoprotein alpha subunit